ncbi:DUF899 family protein [Gryllotalpicola ginsengisoli]|uniref:DUF899 family protein n=1 Tax=Gryllotalpicola ginsengisoli TaxID=444608 RepID=UPI0003B307FE|nr:DUF899 family protein [Gryllotalpicola ginsengisoli]
MTEPASETAAPPVVDRATWQRARDELLQLEKEHTRASDALAAARRRLPMTEVAVRDVIGPEGPVSLLDVFDGRDQLLVYKHMFYDGQPMEAQCEGCTITVWNFQDASYLKARGVSFAIFSSGPWEEISALRDFMGYSLPWYSTHHLDDPVYRQTKRLAAFLRRGDRVFLSYETTDRGLEVLNPTFGLLDRTVYGRQEVWEDSPPGWPQGPTYAYWRTDEHGALITEHRRGRPTAQWTRPGATPVGEHAAHHHEH